MPHLLISQNNMSCFGNEYMVAFLAFNVKSEVAIIVFHHNVGDLYMFMRWNVTYTICKRLHAISTTLEKSLPLTINIIRHVLAFDIRSEVATSGSFTACQRPLHVYGM